MNSFYERKKHGKWPHGNLPALFLLIFIMLVIIFVVFNLLIRTPAH